MDEIGYCRFYEQVELRAPEHWALLKNPKSSVRKKLQRILVGYDRFNAGVSTTTPSAIPLERAMNEIDARRIELDVAVEKYETSRRRVEGLSEALQIADVENEKNKRVLDEARREYWGAYGDWQRLG